MQGALSRILPIIGGPEYARTILLSRVVTLVLLYAAPVWIQALRTKEYKRRLSSIYRLRALRTISGFRTISDEAAIDILADEISRIYKRRMMDQHDVNRIKRIKMEEKADGKLVGPYNKRQMGIKTDTDNSRLDTSKTRGMQLPSYAVPVWSWRLSQIPLPIWTRQFTILPGVPERR